MQKIEDLIGKTNTDSFNSLWLTNHVTREDIDSLKSWGFNSVRLPMHYNLYTLPIEDEPISGEHTWLSKGFELTDSLVSWCKANEMYVVLDLHAAPGGQGKDAAISDYDPSKPSLWESKKNRDKMVALWKKIATKYANEPWVAGYDLLNEPNWDLPGGVMLKNLYKEVTDSIRTVDQKHILFIEGNWFANDFTGLTPPWDINLVYAPHKYWSLNDQGSIQSFLDLRNTHNVPLYLGETGENSNVWFRDAVRLYEDNQMGWAWWPMKKIESIAGPLSIIKSEGYSSLLDYWNNGGTKPSVDFATSVLFDLANDLKIKNCRYQKDVIDALFRQVYSNETIPFKKHTIPGVIYASDYDLGVAGEAYDDQDLANYSLSTGEYTAGNSGWAYRNDGVDIEKSEDLLSNGYNIGFTQNGEWTQYEVIIESDGVYDLHVRSSSGGSGGRMYFSIDGSHITPSTFTYPTGGWQNWETTIIPNLILYQGTHNLRFYVEKAGFNVSRFEFIKSNNSIDSMPTKFLAAQTADEYSINVFVNKKLDGETPIDVEDFEIVIDGSSIPVKPANLSNVNPRVIHFKLYRTLNYLDKIKITYDGNEVKAIDSSELISFLNESVLNNLNFVFQIPTKIESEEFTYQEGVVLESSLDVGGGQSIGYLDPGDYIDYEVYVTQSGDYYLKYRTAAEYGTGGLKIQLIDTGGNISQVSQPVFSSTGNWQNWKTTTEVVQLEEGRYTLRLLVTQAPFNLNWIEFVSTSLGIRRNKDHTQSILFFPNPCSEFLNLVYSQTKKQSISLDIIDGMGKVIMRKEYSQITKLNDRIYVNDIPDGVYVMLFKWSNGSTLTKKFIKVNH